MVALLAEHREEERAGGRKTAEAAARVCAAIDLGTNNCRLLVALASPQGFRVIDAFSRIVRLGEGLSRSERLSDLAMERTLAALQVCSRKLRRRAASAVRAVATEACRRAVNCHEFLTLVRRETGISFEIISSREEGRLAIAGCSALLDPGLPHALVFDIGGGSTEVMWLKMRPGQRPVLVDHVSVRRGVVCLAEQYGGDRVPAAVYRTMVDGIAAELAEFQARNGIAAAVARGAVQMLGTSGTVTTLAGIHLRLPRYDRSRVDGTYLTADEARNAIRGLLDLDLAALAEHPCIGMDRADLIIGGCAILDALLRLFPVASLRIADRGLREGILTDMISGGWPAPTPNW